MRVKLTPELLASVHELATDCGYGPGPDDRPDQILVARLRASLAMDFPDGPPETEYEIAYSACLGPNGEYRDESGTPRPEYDAAGREFAARMPRSFAVLDAELEGRLEARPSDEDGEHEAALRRMFESSVALDSDALEDVVRVLTSPLMLDGDGWRCVLDIEDN